MRFDVKTHSTKLLLVAYFALLGLFMVLWEIDSGMLHAQSARVESSNQAAMKMRTIADLMEIARTRIRITHVMVASDDLFEKDELGQQISALGGKFIAGYTEFSNLDLTQEEQAIIEQQRQHIPQAVEGLRKILELAFQETGEAEQEARSIILQEVAPAQEQVMAGFMAMLRALQSDIDQASQEARIEHHQNNQVRTVLALLILICSLGVLFWLTKRMRQIEHQLNATSRTDGLTQIPNRRCFDERLAAEWKHAERAGGALSLMLVDVDHFKDYNDCYGHQQGDQCLVAIAQVIAAVAQRENDMPARYGGEEFALILPHTNAAGARRKADQLLKRIRQEAIEHTGSSVGDIVTVSIGIATLTPRRGDNHPDELIELADSALYAAKAGGRNRASASPPD